MRKFQIIFLEIKKYKSSTELVFCFPWGLEDASDSTESSSVGDTLSSCVKIKVDWSLSTYRLSSCELLPWNLCRVCRPSAQSPSSNASTATQPFSHTNTSGGRNSRILCVFLLVDQILFLGFDWGLFKCHFLNFLPSLLWQNVSSFSQISLKFSLFSYFACEEKKWWNYLVRLI